MDIKDAQAVNPPSHCLDLRILHKNGLGSLEPEQFLLSLEPTGWDWQPGQFVMLRPAAWGLDPVWGRAFSIAWSDEKSLTLFVQRCGRGTELISRLKPGDTVTVWGPLGNSFAVEPDAPTLILAGGIGLAPFMGYTVRHPRPENLRLFLGHRRPIETFPMELFTERLPEVEHFHEDAPDKLPRFLQLIEERITAHPAEGLILCCGPDPFMRYVKKLCHVHGKRCQISLENRMGCGVGACLGCVCKVGKGHHKQVCTAGPVFWIDNVRLEGE